MGLFLYSNGKVMREATVSKIGHEKKMNGFGDTPGFWASLKLH